MCLCVCVIVRNVEFHRSRQVKAGRERQRQVEKGRGRQRQAEAAKVVGNVPSLYIPFIRQKQVEKGRGR